ncbi:2-oxoacid:acceptor oxidoreductase family protein [Desulfovibrio sp. X2]|uniref:2-oxoacid:acceptor oxidoreductase family protein n=1 Tax=Desulfovibrio sp. X2 TaxID=941449 RepID=UPI000558EACE|nr:2-oxoacid:acceptor oxidoreductase family protein [Desulfovibrio sp. X2]
MKPMELHRFEIRLSGTGGQGIITLGRILGSGLALGHGYNVTQTQSYGPEARGGASRSDLVISSQAISYPKTESVDLLVALSQEACYAYYRYIKPGGVLLVDTGLVRQTPSNVFLGLPFTDLTMKKIKVPQAMNVVVLGALTWLLPFAEQKIMKQALRDSMPPKILDTNLKAFQLGYSEAKKRFDPHEAWGKKENEDEADERIVL